MWKAAEHLRFKGAEQSGGRIEGSDTVRLLLSAGVLVFLLHLITVKFASGKYMPSFIQSSYFLTLKAFKSRVIWAPTWCGFCLSKVLSTPKSHWFPLELSASWSLDQCVWRMGLQMSHILVLWHWGMRGMWREYSPEGSKCCHFWTSSCFFLMAYRECGWIPFSMEFESFVSC